MAIYILFLPCYLHANRGSDYSAYSLNYSTEQTKEERMARTIKPNVLFRLKGWAYFIDLTLKQTYDTVNKGN